MNRNYKKIVGSALAGIMVVSSMSSFAASPVNETADKGEALYKLGLFQGYSKDKMELGLQDGLTREQAIKLTLTLLGYTEEDLNKEAKTQFTDGTKGTEWAEPWVKLATDLGITSGITEEKFGYGEPVTKHQLTTFMLRALGYNNAWANAASLGFELDLIDANDLTTFEEASKREHFVEIGYNTLNKEVEGENKLLIDKLVDASVVEAEVAKELGIVKKVEAESFEVENTEALNLVNTEITFSQDLDKDTLVKENFRVNNKTVKEVKKDGDNKVILFHQAIDNGDEVKVEVKNVKNTSGDKIEKSTFKLTYLDRQIPTLEGVEVVGAKTIRLTFSEPMKSTGDLFNKNAFKVIKENGSKIYVKTAKVAAKDKNQIDLELLTKLEQQEYTVEVNAQVTDYAGFANIQKDTINVDKDTVAPTVVGVKDLSKNSVTLIFDEDVKETSKATQESFYHTNKTNKVDKTDGYKVKGNEVILNFKDHNLPQGKGYIFIQEDALEDLWGNKISDIRFDVSLEEDQEAPVVKSIEQKDNNRTLKITFEKKDLDVSSVRDKDNYEIINAKGKKVRFSLPTLKDDVVTLNLHEDLVGEATIIVKGIKDESGNKMEDYEEQLEFSDAKAPEFPTKVSYFNTDDTHILSIKFDEKSRMEEEGSYSVLDEDKYLISYTDLANKNHDVELKDLDDAELTLSDDGVTVEIRIPKDSISKFKAFAKVSVARVADIQGNKTKDLVAQIVVDSVTYMTVEKVEATDINKVEVTFSERLDDVEIEDFQFTKDSEEFIIASSDVRIDKDSHTVIDFILEKELAYNTKNLKFDVKGEKSVSAYGVKVAKVQKDVKDAIKPKFDEEESKKVTKASKYAGLYLVFKEEMNKAMTDLMSTDLVVTRDGEELVAGNDYRINVSRNIIQLLLKKQEAGNYEVNVKEARYIEDLNGNKVQDFNFEYSVEDDQNQNTPTSIAVEAVRATESSVIQIVLNDTFTNIVKSDFQIKWGSEEEEFENVDIKSIDHSTDDNGKSLLTLNLADKIGTTTNGVKVHVVGQESDNGFGVKLDKGEFNVEDKIRPVLNRNWSDTLSGGWNELALRREIDLISKRVEPMVVMTRESMEAARVNNKDAAFIGIDVQMPMPSGKEGPKLVFSENISFDKSVASQLNVTNAAGTKLVFNTDFTVETKTDVYTSLTYVFIKFKDNVAPSTMTVSVVDDNQVLKDASGNPAEAFSYKFNYLGKNIIIDSAVGTALDQVEVTLDGYVYNIEKDTFILTLTNETGSTELGIKTVTTAQRGNKTYVTITLEEGGRYTYDNIKLTAKAVNNVESEQGLKLKIVTPLSITDGVAPILNANSTKQLNNPAEASLKTKFYLSFVEAMRYNNSYVNQIQVKNTASNQVLTSGTHYTVEQVDEGLIQINFVSGLNATYTNGGVTATITGDDVLTDLAGNSVKGATYNFDGKISLDEDGTQFLNPNRRKRNIVYLKFNSDVKTVNLTSLANEMSIYRTPYGGGTATKLTYGTDYQVRGGSKRFNIILQYPYAQLDGATYRIVANNVKNLVTVTNEKEIRDFDITVSH